MVVCKCRKATKLYCFVHEVPVCGECICFPEHQTCVVRAYSEWVINGEYDWPPTCCKCQADVRAEIDPKLSRLGCLHIIHTKCLISHIQSIPPNTAPAGYVCPLCSSSLWPPKSIKDSGSLLHLKLREAFSQSGLEKNILGDQMISHPIAAPHGPPPAFASDPLVSVSADVKEGRLSDRYNPEIGVAKLGEEGIVELDVSGNGGNQFSSTHEQSFSKSTSPGAPGATTRKSAAHTVDRQNSEISYYADDEDGNRKKYTRRGPFRHKFFRFLLPFWSSALPTLPVTAPPAKESREGPGADDLPEGRPRKRASRMDPRKILLFLAIMACLATMAILYYRLAQRSFLDDVPEDNHE